MLELEATKEILTSFIGISFVLLSAGLVWLLKSAYEKHTSEVLALKKYERIFVNNLTILKDNFGFIDKWIFALKQNRTYSVFFENYYINEEESYKLSNIGLINEVLFVNYMLRRTSLDISHIYESYWKVIFQIDSTQDEEQKKKKLKAYNENILRNIKRIKQNYEPIESKMIYTVAYIRVADMVRRHSFFGYINLLFKDIFPRVTKKSIEKEIIILKESLKEKKKNIE